MKSLINKYMVASVILAAVLISCGSSPSPNPSPNPPRQAAPSPQYNFEARRNIYMSIVREAGLEPRIDVDGDIEFLSDGETFYIVVDENDPSFVYLVSPFWRIDSAEEKLLAVVAMGNANRDAKVAKAYFVNISQDREGIVVGVELFLEDPNSMRALFSRMIDAIGYVKESIYRQMH